MPDALTIATLVAATNVVSFGAIGLDKWFAVRRMRRIPERTLLLLALLFAAPGAWAAVSVFRHKTRKNPFRLQLVVVTFVQIAAAVALWQL